jgi:3-deoxy-D-manno-octulosonic-acid transferase
VRALLWTFFWFVYFPLIRMIDLIFFWHSKVIERNRFEKRNKFEWLAHSFSETRAVADLCFEFSSEGEFQQVAPLIDDALKAGKKIELVFFSPSVEKTIMKLAAQHPDQIRYLRYPLVRLFPFIQRRSFTHWVTSRTLIMVRYDLLPELLLWSLKEGHTLRMVWMTFKKERSKGKTSSYWKRFFLMASDKIVWAGLPDQRDGEALGKKGEVYDFRMEQIRRRVEKREEKFCTHFALYEDFKHHLVGKKTLILGNAWPSDLFLLRDIPTDVVLVVVPHDLGQEILDLFRKELIALGREIFEINERTHAFFPSSTILINKKGILCELYADFSQAYVGGGFEGSIHSVLEPLVAGSARIACGPLHHRSTEYDVALSCGVISEVNTPEQFLAWFNHEGKSKEHAKMMTKDYEAMREFIISC